MFADAELLQLLFSIANTHLLLEMGARSWQENYGKSDHMVHLISIDYHTFHLNFVSLPHQVATVLLLFTLSGPVKASTYLVINSILTYDSCRSCSNASVQFKTCKLTIHIFYLEINIYWCCC